jgi:rhodanese-related sulfurtransferase
MKAMLIKALSAAALALCLSFPALAGDFSNLPQHKISRSGLYYTPAEASAAMTAEGAKTLFLDLRTPQEIAFLGMPTQADANVPYGLMVDPLRFDERAKNFAFELNSGFTMEVAKRLAAKGLTKDDRVILICRSGDRSARAADLLQAAGYTKVYSIPEGFEGDTAKEGERKGQRVVNGWKIANQPWSYQLDKVKMYQLD